MTKLFAVPFGTDGTCGDSSWLPSVLSVNEQDTFNSLRDKLRGEILEPESEFAGMDLDEAMEDLAGFWIVSEDTKRAIGYASSGVEIGSDSALYRHIHTLKTMAQGMAIRTLSKDA